MTDKQIVFCDEYLKDFNASKAAIRAGYSPKTAYSIGNENLRKPEIKKHIANKKMGICNQNQLSLTSLIQDVSVIKDRCIYDEFDAGNALKACDLLAKFLIHLELKQKDYLSKLSNIEIEEMAKELLLKRIKSNEEL